jgi:hypothetical protein
MIIAALLTAAVSTPGAAQKKKPAVKPTAAKTKKAPPKAGLKQGPAVQMPGDNGKVGINYRLGEKGSELVFTLEKAEFASRVVLAESTLFANPGQRLLILSYAVQNPASADRFFFNQSFKFTVVSPDDKNLVCDVAGIHPVRLDTLSLQLKPAQKVRALAVMQVHPKGPVNKLIVQRGEGTPVLRYDLRDKVKSFTSAFAAEDGFDILDVGKAKLSAPFELGYYDINVEKVEESTAAVDGIQPESGSKLIMATVSLKNATNQNAHMHGSIVTAKALDDNGEELTWRAMAKMSSGDAFNQFIAPGQQARLRLIFEAGLRSKPVSITLTEQHSSRSVAVSLGTAK